MKPTEKDIVTLEFHGKKRMGIVLQTGVIPGSSVVAIGYGVRDRHDDSVFVEANSRLGKILRIYKDTSFYAKRTHIISNDSIYPTGRKCPKRLFQRLVSFVGDAIKNNFDEVNAPKEKELQRFSTGTFSVTLGDLLKGES